MSLVGHGRHRSPLQASSPLVPRCRQLPRSRDQRRRSQRVRRRDGHNHHRFDYTGEQAPTTASGGKGHHRQRHYRVRLGPGGDCSRLDPASASFVKLVSASISALRQGSSPFQCSTWTFDLRQRSVLSHGWLEDRGWIRFERSHCSSCWRSRAVNNNFEIVRLPDSIRRPAAGVAVGAGAPRFRHSRRGHQQRAAGSLSITNLGLLPTRVFVNLSLGFSIVGNSCDSGTGGCFHGARRNDLHSVGPVQSPLAWQLWRASRDNSRRRTGYLRSADPQRSGQLTRVDPVGEPNLASGEFQVELATRQAAASRITTLRRSGSTSAGIR